MAKLLEKNGAEMASALVEMITPIKSFMDDPEFVQAFKNCTLTGLRTKATDILKIYVELAPHLLGDKHLKDTIKIMAIVEGTTVTKMLKMNGTELLGDILKAWKEQIQPFFTQLGLSVRTE